MLSLRQSRALFSPGMSFVKFGSWSLMNLKPKIVVVCLDGSEALWEHLPVWLRRLRLWQSALPRQVMKNGQGTVASVTEAEFISSPTDEFADVEYLGELMAVSDPAMLTDQAFADLF